MHKSLALVPAAILLVADCSSGTSAATQTVTVTVTASASAPAMQKTSAPAQQSKSQSASGLKVLKFGETFVGSRSEVTLGVPQPMAAPGYKTTHSEFVSIDVTLKNNGTEVMDTTGMIFSGTSGGESADTNIYSQGIGNPYVDVLPGQSVTFKIGVGLKDPNDLTVGTSYGIASTSAYWKK